MCGWLDSLEIGISFPDMLDELEFLFGFKEQGTKFIVLNFILLLAKFYVYKTKVFGDGILDTYGFFRELKHRLHIEKLACIKDGAYEKGFAKWLKLYEEL